MKSTFRSVVATAVRAGLPALTLVAGLFVAAAPAAAATQYKEARTWIPYGKRETYRDLKCPQSLPYFAGPIAAGTGAGGVKPDINSVDYSQPSGRPEQVRITFGPNSGPDYPVNLYWACTSEPRGLPEGIVLRKTGTLSANGTLSLNLACPYNYPRAQGHDVARGGADEVDGPTVLPIPVPGQGVAPDNVAITFREHGDQVSEVWLIVTCVPTP